MWNILLQWASVYPKSVHWYISSEEVPSNRIAWSRVYVFEILIGAAKVSIKAFEQDKAEIGLFQMTVANIIIVVKDHTFMHVWLGEWGPRSRPLLFYLPRFRYKSLFNLTWHLSVGVIRENANPEPVISCQSLFQRAGLHLSILL